MAKHEDKVQIEDLNTEQRKRLGDGLNNIIVQKTFIDDTKASLKDFTDSLADELGIDAKDIKAAADVIYKQNFFDKSHNQEKIETILSITGNLPQADDY